MYQNLGLLQIKIWDYYVSNSEFIISNSKFVTFKI